MKKAVEKAFQQKVFIIVKQACVHTNIAGVKGHKSCNYLITFTETLSTSVMQPFQQETHSQTLVLSLQHSHSHTLSFFLFSQTLWHLHNLCHTKTLVGRNLFCFLTTKNVF